MQVHLNPVLANFIVANDTKAMKKNCDSQGVRDPWHVFSSTFN